MSSDHKLMRDQIYIFLSRTITVILALLAGVIPLLFLNLTTNFYDTPKLILLVFSTILLLGLWILSWVARGKIEITRTPLDVPLLLLLAAILMSTYFNSSLYPSIFGVFPDVHGSAISWVTYILLYFIVVSNLRTPGRVKLLLYSLYTSAFVVALISVLSFFQVFLPFEMAQGVNFTPTGSTFSTTALLLLLLPLPLVSTVKNSGHLPQVIAIILAIIFSMAIVLIASTTAIVLLILMFIAVFFAVRQDLSYSVFLLFLAPVLISVFLLLFTNISFGGNTLHTMKNSFPQEVQLPAGISWKISATAFRDSPLIGTGPATFPYNFTSYKPVEFNQLRIWSFSFNSAHNEFLQSLGTIGFFGFISLVILSLIIVFMALKQIFVKRVGKQKQNEEILQALAVSGVFAVILMMFHASTLISIVATLFVLAVFMASLKHARAEVGDSVSFKNSNLNFLPILIFIIFLIAAVPVSARAYNAVLADHYHRLAILEADRDGSKTYEYLQKAEVLNPYIDLYRIDMAQTNLALANVIVSQKGPTEDNPEGMLTDDDRQTIQTLIAQAISEGRASVVISPRSARNWETLANIYRNIIGISGNALSFAFDAYSRAIQLDPVNPVLRVSVGSLYYSTGNYDLAIRFFTDAVNLKPDYVNGYYNLAIALRDKGDLESAKMVAEHTVRLLQLDLDQPQGVSQEMARELRSRDLAAATGLLEDIEDRIVSGSDVSEDIDLQTSDLPDIEIPALDGPPDNVIPPTVKENPESVFPKEDQE